MKVEVLANGVFVNGTEIKNVTRADVINLNPCGSAEVVLHIAADEVVVDHAALGVRE